MIEYDISEPVPPEEVIRGIYLIETGPQTNQYHQIMLTGAQYKAINRAITNVHRYKGDRVCFICGDDIIELPSHLKDIYEPDELKLDSE